MATYRIAWLPGDGVGIEVLEAPKGAINLGLIPYTRSRLLNPAVTPL